MPAVLLSPLFNCAQQCDEDGLPLTGAKIFAYEAGSFSTLQATYTDNTGSVANTNPLVLNSSGRPDTNIWLLASGNYNLVLTLADGTTVITSCDNTTGIPTP